MKNNITCIHVNVLEELGYKILFSHKLDLLETLLGQLDSLVEAVLASVGYINCTNDDRS